MGNYLVHVSVEPDGSVGLDPQGPYELRPDDELTLRIATTSALHEVAELVFYPAGSDGLRGWEIGRWPKDGVTMHHGAIGIYRIAKKGLDVTITDIETPEADAIYYFSGVVRRMTDGKRYPFDPEVINKPGGYQEPDD